MAKGLYIGVDNKARKVKKGYIGVSNKARKIKKMYIGIGGKARPCWSGGELEYYGTITGLSVARHSLVATSIGGYALFGGGFDDNSTSTYRDSAVVDAYDQALTRTTPTPFMVNGTQYMYLAATTVGNYALFSPQSSARGTLNAYDTALTLSYKNTSRISRSNVATTVGDYALFCGNMIQVFDAALTETYISTSLYTARAFYPAATTIGNHALIGGGATDSSGISLTSEVAAVDTSLTVTVPTALSTARFYLGATTVDGHALFGGGAVNASYDPTNVVDAYDQALTRTTPTPLSVARCILAATTIKNFALFCAGAEDSGLSSVVDAYDQALTRTTPTPLSTGYYYHAATSVGDFALIGGGLYNKSVATVEAYTVA